MPRAGGWSSRRGTSCRSRSPRRSATACPSPLRRPDRRGRGAGRVIVVRRRCSSDDRFETAWRGRARGRLPRAARRAGPSRASGRAASSLVFFARGARVHGRRPRARAATSPRGPRRARAQRAVRGGAHRARALAAAGPHGQPARDRARPGRGARRGRPAGAGARSARTRARSATLEGDELVVSAADGRGRARRRSAPARPRRRGSPATSSSPRSRSRSRTPPATTRLLAVDPMLAAGYAAYLGVPLVRPGGRAARRARRLRAPRRDDGGRRRSRRCSRSPANTSAALSNAELYSRVVAREGAQRRDPRQHRRRDRRRRPRRAGRPLERGRRADHGRAAGGRARPHAPSRCSSATLEVATSDAPGRRRLVVDPARRRGGLAVADRGGDARPGGRGRRPDLRLPRHLRRPDGRGRSSRTSWPRSRTSCARR